MNQANKESSESSESSEGNEDGMLGRTTREQDLSELVLSRFALQIYLVGLYGNFSDFRGVNTKRLIVGDNFKEVI